MMHTTIRPVMGLLLGLGCAAVSVSAAALDGRSQPPQEPGAQAATQPADETEQEKPAPSDDGAPVRTPAKVSAEDVLKAFQKDRPTRVPIAPSGGLEDADSAEDDPRTTGTSCRLPDGFFLVDRVGRVVRDGNWYVFVFEGYDESHPEPPIKLLPNQLLERMVVESGDATSSTVFIVSGEVTEFMSENFLLLRKLLRRRNLGNLEK